MARCLESVAKQSLLPSEVVLIDDDELDEAFVGGWRARFGGLGAALDYRRKNHRVERRGLAESKNLALEMVSQEVVFVFDDDVVLEPDFCARIMAVWEERRADANLVGVGGIISNHRRRSGAERAFHRFFGLGSALAWDVNGVGFQVWDEDIQERAVGHFAHGGVCAYDRNKARELKFSVFAGGRSALEDVDFCARAKLRGWHFVIEPAARVEHRHSAAAREGEFLAGRKEAANRREIFRTLNPQADLRRRAWFCWANFGWILRQLLVGNWVKGVGMVVGSWWGVS